MFLPLLSLFGVLFICWAFLTYEDYSFAKLPGPKGVPIFDMLFSAWLNYSRLLDWITDEIAPHYPSTFSAKIPAVPRIVVITSPECVEHILKTNFENFGKGSYFQGIFGTLLGNGIFNSDGWKWKMQRKISSNIFTQKNFRTHISQVLLSHIEDIEKKLDRLVQERGEKAVIDMQDVFHRFTFDSISEIAFGINVGSQNNVLVPFQQSFDSAQFWTQLRFIFPYWQYYSFLLPSEYILARHVKVLDNFAKKVITARRQDQNLHSRQDLLSLFLKDNQSLSSEEETPEENSPPKKDLTDEDLRDVILNFIIAGRDTTAQALSWALWLISQNPFVEQNILDEIQDNPEVTYENVKELKYLEAVMFETLRLYPSVPKDLKMAFENDILPDGTKIKKGWLVIYSAWIMGRDSKLWEEPLKFKPERWLVPPQNTVQAQGHSKYREYSVRKESSCKFTAFQAGPRICLGKELAITEAKLCLAKLLPKFQFKLRSRADVPVPEQMSVTLPMKRGLMVSVSHRETKTRS